QRSRWFLLGGVFLCVGVGNSACNAVLGPQGEGNSNNARGGGGDGDGDGDGDGTIVPVDPGTKGIHRLNTNEYNATVADVLGTSLAPATANWRGGELEGFDNMASVLGVDGTQYERYLNAAEALVSEALESETLRDRLIPCSNQDDEACVRSTLEGSGLRIFRRPLNEDEIATYSKVYHDARALGDDHYASAGLMIQALLSSAEFLYRIELDADPTS